RHALDQNGADHDDQHHHQQADQRDHDAGCDAIHHFRALLRGHAPMAAAGMALDQRRAARIDGDRAIAGGLDAHEWAPGTGAPGAAGSTVGIATLPTAGETIRIVRPRRVVWGALNWRTRTINRNVMISSKNATMISAVRSAGNDASGSWVTIAEGIVV